MRKIIHRQDIPCRTEHVKSQADTEASVRVALYGKDRSEEPTWGSERIVAFSLIGDEAEHDGAWFEVRLGDLWAALDGGEPR